MPRNGSLSIAQPSVKPLAAAAIFISIGIIVADESDLATGWWLGMGLISWITVMVCSNEIVNTIAAGTLILTSGATAMTVSHAVPGNDIALITSGMQRDDEILMSVSGTINSFVTEDSTRIRFDYSLESINGVDRVVSAPGRARPGE